MNLSKLITIGVYGYTEEEFFAALTSVEAQVPLTLVTQ